MSIHATSRPHIWATNAPLTMPSDGNVHQHVDRANTSPPQPRVIAANRSLRMANSVAVTRTLRPEEIALASPFALTSAKALPTCCNGCWIVRRTKVITSTSPSGEARACSRKRGISRSYTVGTLSVAGHKRPWIERPMRPLAPKALKGFELAGNGQATALAGARSTISTSPEAKRPNASAAALGKCSRSMTRVVRVSVGQNKAGFTHGCSFL
jgi:hypothetical protein